MGFKMFTERIAHIKSNAKIKIIFMRKRKTIIFNEVTGLKAATTFKDLRYDYFYVVTVDLNKGKSY